MLLQTNSYIVPKEKRAEHARLMRRFRQILNRLGCDDFEIYEQVGANWSNQTSGRYVQIMRFRDRKHQLAVQNAERNDPSAQALIAEFCDLINYPLQQQQQQFAVGFYNSVLPAAPTRIRPGGEQSAVDEGAAGDESGGNALATAAAGAAAGAVATEMFDTDATPEAEGAESVAVEDTAVEEAEPVAPEAEPLAEEPAVPGAEDLTEPGVMPEDETIDAEVEPAPTTAAADESDEVLGFEEELVAAEPDNAAAVPAEDALTEQPAEPVAGEDETASGGHPLDDELSLDDFAFEGETEAAGDDDISRLAEELSAAEEDPRVRRRGSDNGAH